ncbi:hypothetical protein PAAG_12315 [Paracoccidioides lutzii Pb01]|uniref:F-box domain-containing protein n=1 Tax=Paracoccidioides lutzii (strain ATCC MYA-826 / Pb01) TaxID=502779 RepID=A0A0A2V4C1_PARBA|nr:hypothetical protein PAAG_12315 [Paracoccidioides lutzii Pb01]KGQ01005.1 hypothetical protein PAAG_12315 [Paracoccidioides lutzii Pb01]
MANFVETKDEPKSAAFTGYGSGWTNGRSFHDDGDQHDSDSMYNVPFGERTELTYEDAPGVRILPDDPNYEYHSNSDDEILEYDSGASGEEDYRGSEQDPSEGGPANACESEWTFKSQAQMCRNMTRNSPNASIENRKDGNLEQIPSILSVKFAPVRHDVNDSSPECDFILEAVSNSYDEFTVFALRRLQFHSYDLPSGWQSQEELNEIGLPFHPTCFELYMQASRRILGCVDIDTGPEQVWTHAIGDEYLVANSVFIPGCKATLESAISNDGNFSVHDSAFRTRPRTTNASSQDPFLSLPIEIILEIISHLNSPDIANLRLSSRAFTHLPISFWPSTYPEGTALAVRSVVCRSSTILLDDSCDP